MKLPKIIRDFFASIQDYINTERELIRLKIVKKGSDVIAAIFSYLFIIILFHIAMAFAGIWLGLWLSDIFGSFIMGFGVTVLFYMLWLILVIVFRKSLLVKPFANLLVAAFTENDQKPEDKE